MNQQPLKIRCRESGSCDVDICTDPELSSLACVTNFFNFTSQTSVTAFADISLRQKTQTVRNKGKGGGGNKLLQ